MTYNQLPLTHWIEVILKIEKVFFESKVSRVTALLVKRMNQKNNLTKSRKRRHAQSAVKVEWINKQNVAEQILT